MDINEVLSGFSQGHLLVCVLVGALTGLAAALLGIRYAIIIGFINGLAELLPYLGPLLGAIPSLALALTEGTRQAVYLGVAILVIQQLEANLLSPRIVGNRVGLHPLVVIFALLAGGELFGKWGILLAVQVAAVLKVWSSSPFTIWLIDTKCFHGTQYNLDGKRRTFCCLRAMR